MRKILPMVTLCGLLWCLPAGTLNAAFSNADAGTTTAQFLKLGAGVRAAALGDSFVGVADDATAVYWNPAGLSQLNSASVTMMHSTWLDGTFYDWFSFACPLGQTGAIGVGVQYLAYGALPHIDNNGTESGTFNPNDLSATVSYAQWVGGFLAGVSAKYISSTIETSATAFAADLGLMHKSLNGALSTGLAVQNLGTTMKFDTAEEQLPLTVRLGAGYAVKRGWLLTADVTAPIDHDPVFGGGIEYTRQFAKSLNIALRGGYSTQARDLGISGVRGGLGIAYGNYRLDYAFLPSGDFDSAQKFSFSINF